MPTGEQRNRLSEHLAQLDAPRPDIKAAGTVPREYGDPATVRRTGAGVWYVVTLGGNWGRTGYTTAAAARKAAAKTLRGNVKGRAIARNRSGVKWRPKSGTWQSTGNGYALELAGGGVYRISKRNRGAAAERWGLKYTGPRGGRVDLKRHPTLAKAKAAANRHGKR